MPTHSKSASSDPSSTMRSFAQSLALLVVAIIVFAVIMFPRPKTGGPGNLDSDKAQVAASISANQNKRHSMRLAPPAEDSMESSQRQVVETSKKQPTDPKAPPMQTPDAGDPEVQRAISMIDAGQVSEAVAILEALLKKDARNESALVELAMINLLDLKQPEVAMGYLQRVMDVNPQNQVVLSELVSLYEDQGRLEEGLAFLMDVQTREPNAPELSYGIGQMLALQGRDGEAIAYLEKATQSPENAVRAYRDLAEAYSRSGDPEHALESYNKAIGSQEKDIAEKTAHGMPVTFAEERLNYTKLDKVRELMRVGDFDRAQETLDEVSPAMSGDESFTDLQDKVTRKRAG